LIAIYLSKYYKHIEVNDVNKKCSSTGIEYKIESFESILISHPDFPINYASSSSCSYSIKVPNNNFVKVEMLNFLLPDTAMCSGDYLEFYDGSSIKDKMIGKYCRLPDYIPISISSNGSELFIRSGIIYCVNISGSAQNASICHFRQLPHLLLHTATIPADKRYFRPLAL
jgi:hypothetical protein